MRCPKCHYISFDSGDRCRNCGYEFSLAIDVASLDLPIQTGDEPLGPLSDFSLSHLDTPRPSTPPPSAPAVEAEAVRPSSDLPLFRDRAADDDRPLVTPPAVPRPPLAVRRSTPIIQRSPQRRGFTEEPVLNLTLEEERPAAASQPQERRDTPADGSDEAPREAARAGARLFGGIVDAVILGSIDVLVLYFTLRVCGLELAEIAIIPAVPFIGFLLMLNGGYFIAFTVAGGQTIGKMAASTKVVPADEDAWSDRVPLPQAVLRTAAYLVSLLPAGVGFLPAFVGERRALHDRLAATRVVKA